MNKITHSIIAARIWLLTSLCLSVIVILSMLAQPSDYWAVILVLFPLFALAFSFPAFIALRIALHFITRYCRSSAGIIYWIVGLCACISASYALPAVVLFQNALLGNFGFSLFATLLIYVLLMLLAAMLALALSRNILTRYALQFSTSHTTSRHLINTTYMETNQEFVQPSPESGNNKTLIKGLITGVLILVMMIPTIFVYNLVEERQERQKQIVKEVSSKWASAQTLAGPYIYLPYLEYFTGEKGERKSVSKYLLLLPENLSVNGNIVPTSTHRSIYEVLLYSSQLNLSGNFSVKLPEDVPPENIQFDKARLCMGLSDFKGLEEKVSIRFNNGNYTLTPGLPTTEINEIGLSAPLAVNAISIVQPIAFSGTVKMKGSEQLMFLPLSANSQYTLHSSWPAPSFDGNVLPSERNVTDKGFTANWKFNEANLPYSTVIRDGSFKNAATSFGVNMLQPADQYAKTLRSVKYAILFIGLTFALFFIVEVMQRKPVHPVQYVLVGLALVIFYTLLLSISEFLQFDRAYLIAAIATVSLITLYAKGHFGKWGTAGIFAGVLSGLYGFIFVLIRLEDTALLVGSIGLFIVLALVMYASRKVNWYGTPAVTA